MIELCLVSVLSVAVCAGCVNEPDCAFTAREVPLLTYEPSGYDGNGELDVSRDGVVITLEPASGELAGHVVELRFGIVEVRELSWHEFIRLGVHDP